MCSDALPYSVDVDSARLFKSAGLTLQQRYSGLLSHASGSRMHACLTMQHFTIVARISNARMACYLQEEHLAVMGLTVRSSQGAMLDATPQRLASWRHPGRVTALQV